MRAISNMLSRKKLIGKVLTSSREIFASVWHTGQTRVSFGLSLLARFSTHAWQNEWRQGRSFGLRISLLQIPQFKCLDISSTFTPAITDEVNLFMLLAASSLVLLDRLRKIFFLVQTFEHYAYIAPDLMSTCYLGNGVATTCLPLLKYSALIWMLSWVGILINKTHRSLLSFSTKARSLLWLCFDSFKNCTVEYFLKWRLYFRWRLSWFAL